jgi:negative regulator of flagellin synthesis FlgM
MKVNPDPSSVSSALTDAKALPTKSQASNSAASGGASTSAATPAAGAGSIEISSASRGLQATGSADPTSVDATRVDQIKHAITQGRFQVNAGVVADKLIASAQDLVSAAAGKGH